MPKFKITKRISLEEYGEDWKGCYLDFSAITQKEAIEISKLDKNNTDSFMDILKNKFISGRAITETGISEVKADDLIDFPVDLLVKCVEKISGEIDPKYRGI